MYIYLLCIGADRDRRAVTEEEEAAKVPASLATMWYDEESCRFAACASVAATTLIRSIGTCVWNYVYICVYMYTHIRTQTQPQTQTKTHKHELVCVCVCVSSRGR